MDRKMEQFYRGIYADLKVDQDEAQELMKYFQSLNPPPDKLVWLRATAFRIGCEFLSDEHENNVALLRAINAIVHSLEQTCMRPKDPNGNSEFDADQVESFFKGLFGDLSIEREESAELSDFFRTNVPSEADLVTMRATAFKAAVEYLSDEKESNVSLLRCVNVIVHAFEEECFAPKVYELKLAPEFDLSVGLSDAIQEMWNLDVNRLRPNVDYKINVQEGKKPFWKEDKAEDPLFTFVQKEALKRPTYQAFMALLDNYKANVGESERFGSVEEREIQTFLNAIMETAPMQFCLKYLLAKRVSGIPKDKSGFAKLLYKIWFELYSRDRGGAGRDSVRDSSGFEHVFVGEIKDGAISGFHNWVQFYMEEQKGAVDYRGYVKPKGNNESESDNDDHVLSLQFRWNDVEKFVGTMFIGVSPEFEMAMYTTCFLLGEEENDIVLNTGSDEFQLKINCYKMARDKIGTSFPESTSNCD